MFKKILYPFIFLITLYTCHAQYSISKEFYTSMADSLKPADYTNISLKKLTNIIAYTSLVLPDYDKEKDILVNVIKKDIHLLNEKDQLEAYFFLMLHNFNHHYRNYNETKRLGDSLVKYVKKYPAGNNYKIYTYEALKATEYIENNNYTKGITLINNLLNKGEQFEDLGYLPSTYLGLSHAYYHTFQFKKSTKNTSIADSIATKYSNSQFQDFLNKYIPSNNIEIAIFKYIRTTDERYIKDAENEFNTILKEYPDLLHKKNSWSYTYHLRMGYIKYFKNDIQGAKEQLAKVTLFNHTDSFYLHLNYPKRILQALLKLEDDKEEEAYDYLTDIENMEPTDHIYKEFLARKLYKKFKENKDYERANDMLEDIHHATITQEVFKQQGIIAVVNNNYNIHKKEVEIAELENEINKKRNRDLLLYSLSTILILLLIGITILRAKQNKIKNLINEEKYNRKVHLLENSLKDVDRKITDNRKEIGEKIHNELLSNILAVKYIATDYQKNALEENSKQHFTSIIEELDSIYKDSRNFSHNLINGEKEYRELNIIEYLEGLQLQFKEVDLLNISVSISEQAENYLLNSLNKEEQLAIYHLIKESVSNTIKHANAENLHIKINIKNNICKIILKDDGDKKVKPQFIARKSGIGHKSLIKRFNNIDGNVSFVSKKHTYIVTATLPVRP